MAELDSKDRQLERKLNFVSRPLTINWEIALVNSFRFRHDGLYVSGNHYVKVVDGVCHVQDAEYYRKVNGSWQRVFEEGFDYVLA